jgi:hypothetical protein
MGYPRSETIAGTSKLTFEDVQDLATHWGSILEHRVIYYRMKALGFDPHADLDQKMESAMSTLFDPVILRKRTKTDAYRRAIMITMISRCSLECTPGVARRVAKYATDQGFGIEVEKAEVIVRWVSRTGKTPREIRMALRGCLKRLDIPDSSIRFSEMPSQ